MTSEALPKTYVATVQRPTASPPTAEQLARLCEGVDLPDGRGRGPAAAAGRGRGGRTRALEARLLGQREKPLPPKLVGKVPPSSLFALRVVVTAGGYHVVKKLLAAVGLSVCALHREQVGSLSGL